MNWWKDLSSRAQNVLNNIGITDEQTIKEMVANKRIMKYRNFGKKTYNELAVHFQLPTFDLNKSAVIRKCPNCGKTFDVRISIMSYNSL